MSALSTIKVWAVQHLVPRNEPVVSGAVVATVASYLVSFHVIPNSLATSPDVKTFGPLVIGAAISLLRPLVTPNSKVGKTVEAVLTTAEGVLDGSDGFPKPEDNSLLAKVADVIEKADAAVTAKVTPNTTPGA